MGRFWIEDDLVDKHIHKINGNEVKVLLMIARHYDKSGQCFPSIRRLSVLGKMDASTISKALKQLRLLGFLEQLTIRERCKLRYKFSKSARYLTIDSNKLPEETTSKEIYKGNNKEGFRERLKKEMPEVFKKTYGHINKC